MGGADCTVVSFYKLMKHNEITTGEKIGFNVVFKEIHLFSLNQC